jgi:hypothetical protein
MQVVDFIDYYYYYILYKYILNNIMFKKRSFFRN